MALPRCYLGRLPDPTGETMYHKYPDDFIAAIKTEFPNDIDLHSALDGAETRVGEILKERAEIQIPPRKLLRLLKNGPKGRKELKAMAEKAIRMEALHSRWLTQYLVSG